MCGAWKKNASLNDRVEPPAVGAHILQKAILTDGVFDLVGNFHPLPKIDSDQATIIFREKVFAMMKERNRISDGLVENMRNWRHSGFSVHNEVVINENDREALPFFHTKSIRCA